MKATERARIVARAVGHARASYGAGYAARVARLAPRIVNAAEEANLGLGLAFALVEQESGFANVYGHDPVPNRAPKGGRVTRSNYLHVYLPERRAGRGMQGVGPVQLTYYTLQDEADHRGGCWRPSCSLPVGFANMAGQIRTHGRHGGMAAYNGAGPAAEAYARLLEQRREHWAHALRPPRRHR